jgi:hypothetical protein
MGLIRFVGHGGEPAENAAVWMIEGILFTGKYMRGFVSAEGREDSNWQGSLLARSRVMRSKDMNYKANEKSPLSHFGMRRVGKWG